MVFYCDGISSMTDERFKFFFERMPTARQKKAMRYVKKEDRQLCVIAFALLDYALKLKGYEIGEYEFVESETGKPYLENLPLEFNLSHTSNAVACAVSRTQIGVDVQKKVSEYKSVMRRVYCGNEINLVSNSQNPIDDFTRIWTLKESYVKCIGTGISDNISAYDFSAAAHSGGELYDHNFTVLDCGDYGLSVCSPTPIEKTTKVSVLELYEFGRIKNV